MIDNLYQMVWITLPTNETYRKWYIYIYIYMFYVYDLDMTR